MLLRQIGSLDELACVERNTEIVLARTVEPIDECMTVLGEYQTRKNGGIILRQNVQIPVPIGSFLTRPHKFLEFMRAIRGELDHTSYAKRGDFWYDLACLSGVGSHWNGVYVVAA